MIDDLRRRFNESWTPEAYQRFLGILEARTGAPTAFRHSETPCFFPAALIAKMARYGQEMLDQLLASPDCMSQAAEAIPPSYRVPRQAPEPLFVQADFGLDEQGEPKLVEIQGFPSLYAYQPVMAAAYREAYQIDPSLAALPGLDEDEYWHLLREAVVADHDPAEVILMEVDPDHQKTRCDFIVTRQKLGVDAVDIRSLVERGGKLYRADGTPVKRIYNRTIVDELERRGIGIPFDWTSDLDVEWAGHPNWYFLLSKFSLPHLRHQAVPRTVLVDEAPEIADPERWVLKPLWSFAGLGVIVGPTRDQIAAARGKDCILQERVDFTPVVETPHGPTKVEVRIMYIGRRVVNIIIRMGRGAQMGVDHNKGLAWVGASAGFIQP